MLVSQPWSLCEQEYSGPPIGFKSGSGLHGSLHTPWRYVANLPSTIDTTIVWFYSYLYLYLGRNLICSVWPWRKPNSCSVYYNIFRTLKQVKVKRYPVFIHAILGPDDGSVLMTDKISICCVDTGFELMKPPIKWPRGKLKLPKSEVHVVLIGQPVSLHCLIHLGSHYFEFGVRSPYRRIRGVPDFKFLR